MTITSRQDLIRALNEAVLAGESMGAGHGPRLGQQMLPALRISVVEVPEVCELSEMMCHLAWSCALAVISRVKSHFRA